MWYGTQNQTVELNLLFTNISGAKAFIPCSIVNKAIVMDLTVVIYKVLSGTSSVPIPYHFLCY